MDAIKEAGGRASCYHAPKTPNKIKLLNIR